MRPDLAPPPLNRPPRRAPLRYRSMIFSQGMLVIACLGLPILVILICCGFIMTKIYADFPPGLHLLLSVLAMLGTLLFWTVMARKLTGFGGELTYTGFFHPGALIRTSLRYYAAPLAIYLLLVPMLLGLGFGIATETSAMFALNMVLFHAMILVMIITRDTSTSYSNNFSRGSRIALPYQNLLHHFVFMGLIIISIACWATAKIPMGFVLSDWMLEQSNAVAPPLNEQLNTNPIAVVLCFMLNPIYLLTHLHMTPGVPMAAQVAFAVVCSIIIGGHLYMMRRWLSWDIDALSAYGYEQWLLERHNVERSLRAEEEFHEDEDTAETDPTYPWRPNRAAALEHEEPDAAPETNAPASDVAPIYRYPDTNGMPIEVLVHTFPDGETRLTMRNGLVIIAVMLVGLRVFAPDSGAIWALMFWSMLSLFNPLEGTNSCTYTPQRLMPYIWWHAKSHLKRRLALSLYITAGLCVLQMLPLVLAPIILLLLVQWHLLVVYFAITYRYQLPVFCLLSAAPALAYVASVAMVCMVAMESKGGPVPMQGIATAVVGPWVLLGIVSGLLSWRLKRRFDFLLN